MRPRRDLLLSLLDKPREVAPGRWRCRCPGHDGKSAQALAITEGDDGRVLVHCFAGCEVAAVVHALGLELHDLFSPRPPPDGRAHALRTPFLPAQVFDAARFEVAVVGVIAADIAQRRRLNPADHERLKVAAQRLDDIARRAYGCQ